MPCIDDEKQYFDIRNKLLGEPTARQSQIALSAATADMDNDQTDDQIIKEQTTTNKKPGNYGDKFFIHYTHEQRFNTLKKDMHQIYDDVFQNTPAMYTRMVVGTRNRRDMKNELIRKRTLLQKKITKRKCHPKISSSESNILKFEIIISLFLLNRTTKENHKEIQPSYHN